MKPANLESTFLKTVKRVIMLTIATGLLGNAMHVYGLGFYQGYIETFGFDFMLFPIEWKDGFFWTYIASMEIGFHLFDLMREITFPTFLIIFLSVYLINIIWIQLSKIKPDNRDETNKRKVNVKWVYHLICVPFKWLFIKKQSIITFCESYFFIIFLFFIPLFITIWTFFPWIGHYHGSLVARDYIKRYETVLCGDTEGYWERCIEINVSELNNPKGIVLFKKDSLVGLFTKEGPVIVSIPRNYHYKVNRNPSSYKNDCDKAESESHNKPSKENEKNDTSLSGC